MEVCYAKRVSRLAPRLADEAKETCLHCRSMLVESALQVNIAGMLTQRHTGISTNCVRKASVRSAFCWTHKPAPQPFCKAENCSG